jgi:NitT/TauT family transport system ATP-binding protein
MIQIRAISKTFSNGAGEVHSLRNVSFSVEKGSFVSIIGHSGCGKTTLLKIIGALLEPTQGDVLINNKSSHEAYLEHRFGFVFQEPNLLPWRTALKNIELPGEILQDKAVLARAKEMIKLVNLEGFEQAFPRQLSGGMKTKVSIARALSFHPPILLMDEPFGSLDEITRDAMNLELLRIWEKIKTTVIFVTHSIREAVLLSDKVIVLSPRPGEVKKIVTIDFPRPRTKEMRKLLKFVEFVEDLREQLNP